MITKLDKKLTKEDYDLMLSRYAPVKGCQLNPHAYSRQETEQSLLAYWRFMRELVERYALADAQPWVVSESSGEIFEDDK